MSHRQRNTVHKHRIEQCVMQMAALGDPEAIRASNHLTASRDRRLSKNAKRAHRRTFERLAPGCLSRYADFAKANGLI